MTDIGGTFTWYGHSCVELLTPGGKTLIFDPWFGNPTSPRAAADVTKCDVLLVSHGHFDHIGSAPRDVANADALTIARATKPAWPCIHELSLWLETQLGDAGVEIIGMNKGGTALARGLNVTMVHADHTAGDWSTAGEGPLYLGEPVGFVIGLEDGLRVYFAGDTDVFGDMKFIADLHAPDVAFLPIGGHYTMGPAGCGPGGGAARRARGSAHPLRHVPDPLRDAGPAARRAARRGRRCRGCRPGARRRHSPALMRIRVADPSADAARVAEIYRPYVDETIISFEEAAPSADEMAGRMRAILEWTPWLVAEDTDGRIAGYAYALRASRTGRLSLVGRHLGLRRSGGAWEGCRAGALRGAAIRSSAASDSSTRTPASACPTRRAWRSTSRSACP